MDYQVKHDLELEIKDRLNTLSIPVLIPKAIPQTLEGDGWIRHNVPVYQVLPRYASDDDSDESALETWLDSLLADMPPISSMQIAWNSYPAVTGNTIFATLSKYTSNSYAVVFGASYNGTVYIKRKFNTWQATQKGSIG